MSVCAAIPSFVCSRHLPFKTEDRFEFAAARLNRKSMYRSCSVDGGQWHGELPILPLEGEMSEGGVNHRRLSIWETKGVH
jgi:hypothetical protein